MPNGFPKRVLVVDDDERVRKGMSALLEAEGMEVTTASDGEEALELTRSEDYEVMLIDLLMPKVGGLEALARIRNESPDLATIVVTGYPSYETAVEAMRLGAVDYLSKPFAADELLTVVRQAHRHQQQVCQQREQAAVVASGIHADLAPGQVADQISVQVSSAKATLPWINVGILGTMAGVYIGFGAAIATLVLSDAAQHHGFGVAKLLSGLVFSVGLILVVVAGAELFTGNNLMITGVLRGRVGVHHMLARWTGVYLANFAGSLMLVYIMYASGLWESNDGGVGLTAVKIAYGKVHLAWGAAFFRAIGCNWLVCLAVWMSLSAREVAGKILAIIFPITTFVALGYEHCVANMYFVPMGIYLKETTVGQAATGLGMDLSTLTWESFLVANLVPVTLGNIVGGTLFVGVLYWITYLRKAMREEAEE